MFVGLVTEILCGLDHKNDPSWVGVQNTTNFFFMGAAISSFELNGFHTIEF